MNNDVRDQVSKCEECAFFKPCQQRQPLISHPDYYSNVFEIDQVYSTTSPTIVMKLKSHFARYGIREEVVSDNVSEFISHEFQSFPKSYRFHHMQTSPHHHQSNGKVEAAVKQAKKAVGIAQTANCDFYLALVSIRNTSQKGVASSPAQSLMSRRTRTTLPSATSLRKPRLIMDLQRRTQN